MKRKEYPSDPWFYASFEGARIAALLKTCDLPFSEKLDFIDEAFRLFPKGYERQSAAGVTPVVLRLRIETIALDSLVVARHTSLSLASKTSRL
ncbi:MAG: hypothetical protein ACKO39_09465 [Chthoniobacterales bacterium]